jgi:uncharacterized membrane protein YpjA
MIVPDATKVLMSKQEIMEHLKISDKLYKKFIRMGMPVLFVDGRCYAHKDNIDDFFKAITRVNMLKNAPDEIIDAEQKSDQ